MTALVDEDAYKLSYGFVTRLPQVSNINKSLQSRVLESSSLRACGHYLKCQDYLQHVLVLKEFISHPTTILSIVLFQTLVWLHKTLHSLDTSAIDSQH